MSSTTFSPLIIKSLSNVVISASLDRLVNKNTDLSKNLMFGVQSSIGLYGGNILASYLGPDPLPFLTDTTNNPPYFTSGGLAMRGGEIAGSALGVIYLNKFFGTVNNQQQFNQTIGILAVSDVLSEYASQYLTGNPMQIFATY
jgi:hypothetical protein